MALTMTLNGTSVARGLMLRRRLLGPMACVVYLIFLGACAFATVETGNIGFLLTVTATLLFTLWIVHNYIKDVLLGMLPHDEASLAEWLAPDLMMACSSTIVSSADLVSAAMKTERGQLMVRLLGGRSEEIEVQCRAIVENIAPEELLRGAFALRADLREDRISAVAILLVVLHMENAKPLLNMLDLSTEDISAIALWEELTEDIVHGPRILSPTWLLSTFGAIGRTSLSGYTTTLDLFTQDLTDALVGRRMPRVILHESEMQKMFGVLSAPQASNVLIVGDDGIGKRTLIANVAQRIHGEELKHSKAFTRILRLDTELLVSGSQDPDRLLLHALDRASRREKFLFVLSDVGALLKSADDKFTAVLTRLLATPNVRVIGIVSSGDYYALVKDRPALDRQWTVVELKEPSVSETMAVLIESFLLSRSLRRFALTYASLKSVVTLTSRYLAHGAQPGKSVRVLADAIVYARHHHEDQLREEHIREVIASVVPVDLVASSTHAAQVVSSLKEKLSTDIVGQDHALHAVAQALKRAQADVGTGHGPLAAFLFVGPTGVGKTELAKSVARHLFGSDAALIRLNMNDFADPASAGAILGGGEAGDSYFLRSVQERPFSVVLLDELEKAHPTIQHLFLQALDEGVLLDAHGQRTDFRNTVMIATSNAAAEQIALAAKTASADPHIWRQTVLDALLGVHAFSPEFLNRFTDVIAFAPLSREQAIVIARRMVATIAQQLMESRGIALVVPDATFDRLVTTGFNPAFGAREMRRAVTDIVENAIAEALLKGVQRGGEIRIG